MFILKYIISLYSIYLISNSYINKVFEFSCNSHIRFGIHILFPVSIDLSVIPRVWAVSYNVFSFPTVKTRVDESALFGQIL